MSSTPVKKTGRNDPCTCGSGRKYKQCCMQKDELAMRQAAASLQEGQAILAKAVEHHQAERFGQAKLEYERVLQLEPDNPDALNLLGLLFFQEKNFEAAASFAQQAIAQRKHPLYYNSLGTAQKELGRLDEAMASYRKSIALMDNYFDPHNNLATLYQARGDFVSAIKSYKKALQLTPQSTGALFNLGLTLKEYGEITEAKAVFRKASSLGTNEFGVLASTMQLAVFAYLEGQFETTRLMLDSASAVAHMREGIYSSPNAYYNYMRELLKVERPEQERSSLPVADLFYVGESHTLSASGQILDLGPDGRHKVTCIWIEGCKQWHLANAQQNKYKSQIQAVIERLPAGARMAVQIGEIDCRPSEGILKAWRAKNDIDLQELIVKTVSGFVTFVAQKAAAKRLRISICGVPASNMDLGGMDQVERSDFLNLLPTFNAHLRTHVLQNGMEFVDLYSMTDTGDGRSNKKWHLDANHLSPQAVCEAFSNFRIC